MAGAEGKHWVESLFPPRFGLTLGDLLKDELLPADTVGSLTEAEEGTKTATHDSVFAKLARKVSPLDVAGIKNVYERVWVMTHLEEEEKRRREEQLGKAVCDGKKMRDASTSTSDLADQATQDIHDPCIWNSNEIDVLRSVFQAARDQNLKLRAEIHETRDQFEKLQEKHKKQCGDEEARSTRLREAAKANKRFTIVVQNLKQQLESAVRQIDGLRAQVRHMEESRKTNMAAIHELRVASDRERIDRKKAELELQRQTQEALRERRIHEENLKLMHDEDIQYLQKTLEELGVELDSEKKAHERTKRGLNHLRQHFSSLPMDDQLSPEGLVKDDQLQKWTY